MAGIHRRLKGRRVGTRSEGEGSSPRASTLAPRATHPGVEKFVLANLEVAIAELCRKNLRARRVGSNLGNGRTDTGNAGKGAAFGTLGENPVKIHDFRPLTEFLA